MPRHQAKRPYAGTRSSSQSAITSYFSHASPSQETDINSKPAAYCLSSQPHTSYTPALPHSIQSNLLNVGMRVRKSVPEGYKTGSYSAFTLFADNTVPSDSTYSMSAMSSSPSPPALKTRPRSGARELTPFCGILTVGGMAAQQWGTYNSSGSSGEMDEDSTEEDDVPFLSSQGSTISSSSLQAEGAFTPGGNKRRFFEDEDETSNLFSSSSTGLSPNTFMDTSPVVGERILAVPRRKKSAGGKGPGHISSQVRIFGQENLHGGRNGNGNGDFEDAEFLDYGLAGEVEMSGCN
ncbi:uncharacterized protein RAG0_14068 [Rhynchosporium agropyri]|uniref:Uncharacterized protein n=1 Tax=Rhynchosporium agropyri TaxID=914238 RepID=A0A1E1LFE9_9HELO|nr:uncharacterized protein RAG0_14068 [Rhynchosporium agropyri]